MHALSSELYRLGLRNSTGKAVGVNRLAEILRNPFYIGIIRMKCSGESYAGVHEPIISKSLFDRVQDILDGKLSKRVLVHDFLFRRMIQCAHCGYSLVGETKKGHVYYRCHTRTCPTLSLREELIDATIEARLVPLGLREDEVGEMKERAALLQGDIEKHREDEARAVRLQLDNVSNRLARLMDIYLDGVVERELFEDKKLALLMERKGLEEQRERIATGHVGGNMSQYLELLKSLPLSYKIANPMEKRRLVKTVTSDLRGRGKNVMVELKSPFQEIANLNFVPTGGPLRGRPRTKTKMIFDLLVKHCKAHAEEYQREEEILAA